MFWKHLFSWMVVGLFALAATARAQSFLSPAGSEFVANAFTKGAQSQPALAIRADDGFVAAWRDGGDLPGGIKARLFDATGSPASPEIWVDQSGVPDDGPRIGCAVDGSFAVTWSAGQDVWVRRFDRDGGPLGVKLRVNLIPAPSSLNYFPDLAMAPGGTFVVVWRQIILGVGDALWAARFDNQGGRNGNPFPVSPDGAAVFNPRLAIAVDGGFLAAWEVGYHVMVRRFGPLGASAAPAVQIDDDSDTTYTFVDLAPPFLHSDGTATVIWAVAASGLMGRRLDATGAPLGGVSLISSYFWTEEPLAAATDPAGDILVIGGGNDWLRGLFVDHDLVAQSDVFQVGGQYFAASDPVLAASYSGNFVALWTSGFTQTPTYTTLPTVVGTDGDSAGIAGQRFGPPRCLPSSGLLCLGPDGRFEARLNWKNPLTGETGAGQPVHLTSDTGAFWFFSDQNLELMVKVLDGSGFNGQFWIYTGALSNVEYTLTVTDSITGAERAYHNPPSQFGNVGDVNAFAAAPSFFPVRRFPANPLQQPGEGCPPVTEYNPRSLCLGAGQFSVSVTFEDPSTGALRAAVAVPLGRRDSGVFWFFAETNLELMVKILDGRAVNGGFWFFYGALSDVDYTISVLNTKTGAVKTYHNPKGTLASGADINAFSP
jgi:hypothetical protein